MPGMNSGRSSNNPTLVAAVRAGLRSDGAGPAGLRSDGAGPAGPRSDGTEPARAHVAPRAERSP
jgi:hypothetical protein